MTAKERFFKKIDATSATNLYERAFNEFVTFSLNAFRDATVFSSMEKLQEESKEVVQALTSSPDSLPEEYADCIMCLLDSAARAGVTPREVIRAFIRKLSVNKSRKWVKNPNNTYSHK